MPYTVALTGGIGSGKSTIANAFAALGVPIIDADVIAREVVEPGSAALQRIAERYGERILTEQGALNRPRLREIIFQSPDEKAWLNNLLHPLINARTQQLKALSTAPYVLWVVPLLVENGLQHQADRVLVVDVDEATQLRRTIQRDGIDRQQAQNILSAQATRSARLAVADDVINNSGTPDEALPQVAALHQRYLALAATQQD
ncbi:dephospho-CoA kinase [Pantoea sp. ACRSH]|uniref:dephospho-CoA kinase n=1 Tax=unclassified Pantoea TaxID=2630326 RepID=UPI001EF49ED6|nr:MULTISPECIES: dephospho-CoA kinase [unclassified Pantoea]MCG7366001.1 dephospho-CoA kinase [Pantoea sp. ACRSH]MCG7396629.1 dephospho-CoA kinase [Pantoea sp. ACRSC]